MKVQSIYIYIYILVYVGVFFPHTQLIVLFEEPSPQGFVLVLDCGLWDFHLQGLIRHAWGAFLTDVGLRVSSLKEVKIPKTTLGDEDKSLRTWLPKEDNEPSVRGKNPHRYNDSAEKI